VPLVDLLPSADVLESELDLTGNAIDIMWDNPNLRNAGFTSSDTERQPLHSLSLPTSLSKSASGKFAIKCCKQAIALTTPANECPASVWRIVHQAREGFSELVAHLSGDGERNSVRKDSEVFLSPSAAIRKCRRLRNNVVRQVHLLTGRHTHRAFLL